MNRQIRAFLYALAAFLLTVTAGHFYVQTHVAMDDPAFSFWSMEEKSGNREALCANLNEGSFPVFGSSEFQHGTDTPFHPASVFAGSRFNPMLIGAGYYQSLSHAITLAAIEPYMQVRKAVLIVSPQWFRKTGVVDQAYASRFSESLYYGMLENASLPGDVRDQLRARTMKLMNVDPKMKARLERHDRVNEGTASPLDTVCDGLWERFLTEKDRYMISAAALRARMPSGGGIPDADVQPDWDALHELAQASGEAENQNEFFMLDTSYQRLKPHLKEKKNMNADAAKGYQTGPEFDDLQLFLTVCGELNITPMLVLMPVNGYYYDYTGFPKTAREAYYDKVRTIARDGGARVADFTDQEYTPYFFEDRVHLGQKGWVMVNESLYDFYQSE